MLKSLLCLAAMASALFFACGPVEYINRVTMKASRALAEARAADAEKLFPYEYWTAVEYLNMAREKAAYAYYEVAISYGERSEQAAHEANRLANERMQTRTAQPAPSSEAIPAVTNPRGATAVPRATEGNRP